MKIFISYRRSDTEADAGRLYDQLIQTFSPSDIFMDVDSIAPGKNFVDILKEKLSETDIMLVIIGPAWLTASDKSGRRRIDDPEDFVRKEIATALKKEITVVPVLFRTPTVPEVSSLPDEISTLAYKQGVWLHHNSFASDVKRFVKIIEKEFEKSRGYPFKDFGEAIIREYNKHFIISGGGEDYKFQLYFGSEASISTFFNSHLLKDALTHLIEEADVSGWMKHDEELQPEEFWAAILKAVASSYRLEIPYPTDDQSDADLIRQLLTEIDGLEKP